ncbi:hypothetical protein BDR04DRAFT_1095874 [Suillus decipiens]|nr:hypothetical protein BDR04DRAFT_1095874 [Suillus decipiens]
MEELWRPSTSNSTCPSFVTGESVCLPPVKIPFYFSPRQNVFDGIPDVYVALAAPVVSYWITSLIFCWLDISGWKWLDKYRIHESKEVKSKNTVTPWQVAQAVLFQHATQTVVGFIGAAVSPEISIAWCQSEMEALGSTLVWIVRLFLGEQTGMNFLELGGPGVIHWLYWWGIPAARMLFALFILDTWQYFTHRLMHMNKYLYKHFHSVHHRLYVPYSFGALYNHPLEGIMLDSLGTVLAGRISCLSVRQTIFFFTFSSCKAVSMHGGYNLPFDPFQMMSSNNADYHDIHHQAIGLKSNFAQPFFIHWDVLLGTRMTREDIEEHRKKVKKT